MENLKKKIQLAVNAFKSGRILEAEDLARKLIDSNPNVVFLYNLMGLILVEQKEIDQALSYYEKGIKIDSNFAEIYNNIGVLFFRNRYSGNAKKIEDFYKKSISLNQNMPEAHSNLGNFYNTQNKHEEAIKCYKKAFEINPKFSFALLNLASLYLSLGKINEAKEKLKEAIKISPDMIEAHKVLSRIISYTDDHEHLEELKQLYSDLKGNETEKRMLLAFSLGKAFWDTKDFDKSFKYYHEANNICRKNVSFFSDKEKKIFEEIKNTFTKKIIDKYYNVGFLDLKPIFIVGMPRSGTTLLEQIISSHPKVFGAGEVEIIPKLMKKTFEGKNLLLFFNEIIKFDKENFKNIGEEYSMIMKELSNNAERTTDKLPINFMSVGFIKLIFPNSKIIHCHRSPKDNCVSIFKHHFTSGKVNFANDMNETIQYYNLYKDLMEYWNDLLPGQIYNIKYENLINNNETEIRNLLKYCDLEWNDQCLKFYNNKRPINTASDIQARSKIYNSSIDSWKKYEKHLKKYFIKLNN